MQVDRAAGWGSWIKARSVPKTGYCSIGFPIISYSLLVGSVFGRSFHFHTMIPCNVLYMVGLKGKYG